MVFWFVITLVVLAIGAATFVAGEWLSRRVRIHFVSERDDGDGHGRTFDRAEQGREDPFG